MSTVQQELDSVRQQVAGHEARLREVRDDIKDAKANNDTEALKVLQQENVKLLDLIYKLQENVNRLMSKQLGAAGAGASAGNTSLGVLVELTDQEVSRELQQRFGHLYDRTAGQRLLKELLQRGDNAPIERFPDAIALGKQFPLHGHGPLVRSFAAGLRTMEDKAELFHANKDDFRRGDQGFQLAGPPGVGKTTASLAICAGLHYACSSNTVELLPQATKTWERMRQRILKSLSPSRLLVFRLDLSDGGLNQLHSAERQDRFKNILALRLLYAVLARGNTTYAAFLAALPPLLLQSLKPKQVADFVRQQAGFAASDQLLMVCIFDEAQAFDAQVGPEGSATAIAQLLSAFVDFRFECATSGSATLPVFVTASTLWSRTSLLQTSSHKSSIADLQLLPLSERRCKLILYSVSKRIQQQHQQQQQQQHVEELEQQLLQDGEWPEQQQHQQQQQQQHVEELEQQQLQDGKWPEFYLKSSGSLEDVQLPDTTVALLQLTGGIPRLLSYCLAAMADAPPGERFTPERLLPWLSVPPKDLNTTKNLLTVVVSQDRRWQSFTQKGTRLLLDIAFSHDILHEPVQRTGKVATPELINVFVNSISDSSSNTAQALSDITWELGEQLGLWLLMTADGRRLWLSDPGPSDPRPSPEDAVSGYFVRVVPLLIAAFPPVHVSALAAVMPVLRGNISWRQCEQQDVGVLAVRCLVAKKVFGRDTMTLHRLLKCKDLPQRGSGGILGVEVWLPRQQTAVHVVDQQLKDKEVDAKVDEIKDYGTRPFAFLGPGNKATDGWLVLRQVAHDAFGPARLGEPLIIYTTSKQRQNPQTVSGVAIATEGAKDIISRKYKHVYLYVTDQTVVDEP